MMGWKAAGLGVLGVLPVLIMVIVINVAEGERLNKTSSSGGLFWSTAKEESDLMLKAEPDEDSSAASVVNDHDEVDGGFSSLDGMLQWAIGHSDPEKLKETAQDVQRLSPSELKKRQMEIKELMEKMKMPSDSQLMQIALDDLNNSSLSLEDHHRALQELLILVEPIDNANGMCEFWYSNWHHDMRHETCFFFFFFPRHE
ncbi:hypothetical protein GH714_007468 [Hevea brasiliensis]|uniref:Nucleotide exchange factor Fes1 domain-containing protein n=1 Tax=Hevea brasiliensis TaxID=3981 RepID=A0A6A6KK04_HEVBR|nr:hypothetical protein GH714_007468 [Hevea brasiliensis]